MFIVGLWIQWKIYKFTYRSHFLDLVLVAQNLPKAHKISLFLFAFIIPEV